MCWQTGAESLEIMRVFTPVQLFKGRNFQDLLDPGFFLEGCSLDGINQHQTQGNKQFEESFTSAFIIMFNAPLNFTVIVSRCDVLISHFQRMKSLIVCIFRVLHFAW